MQKTSFNTNKKLLEIACFNIESAIIAEQNGADRIELCTNYLLGGITPNLDTIIEARKKIKIPLHIIVRPRGGNFVFNSSEIETMKQTIIFCNENKIDGVVIGILNNENNIDEIACQQMISLAGKMHITFHRAIDECKIIDQEIKKLIALGVNTMLTSGSKKNVLEGIENIKKWQELYGNNIHIMPGGGIRSNNLKNIVTTTNCDYFHSAAIINDTEKIDAEEVKKLKQILNTDA